MYYNKRKNKGFSLIELIIAIAILVILTGLLAPQFMKYIERAKQAKGIQTLDSINNGVQVAYIDALTDSIDNKATVQQIVINRGETMGGINTTLEDTLIRHLNSIIGEAAIKKSFIFITFDKGTDAGYDDAKLYYISGLIINYYPDDDNINDFYYFLDGDCAVDPSRGNYGEYKNKQYIKWK